MKAKFLLLWITACVSLFSCNNQDSNLLLPMIVDGQYGYINESGKVVIEPQFKYAGVFADGLACVRTYEGYGYINKRGKMVIDPIFDDADDFSDGYAVVRIDEKRYFINKHGDLVTTGYTELEDFSEGLACVEKDGKWGYVNTMGEIVISPQFYEARSFVNGFAMVRTEKYINSWTYIDKTGRSIIDLPLTSDSDNFSEGLAKISLYDIDKGKVILDMFYDTWSTYINEEGDIFKNRYESAGNFNEGLAPVRTDEGWGYIDKHENFVIYPKERFHWAKEFSEGLAAVEIDYDPSEYKDNKYGYIDKSGNLVIRPKYDGALNFSKGLALVYNSDYKYGLIDKNGKVILDTKYSSIRVMSDEWVEISVHKKLEGYKTGLAKTNGRIIVKPEYYYIKYLYDKYFHIVDNNKNSAYMDVNGNWLWTAPSFEIEVNRNNQSGTSKSSANAAPKGLLYKGTYTIAEQGYCAELGGYTESTGSDHEVEIEIYNDYIWIQGVAPATGRFDYEKTSGNWRIYKGTTSMGTTYYKVNPDTYAMQCHTSAYNQYTGGTNTWTYAMSKGKTTFMKGSNNNGSSDNYFNNSDNSKANSNRNISRTKKTCGLCEGKGWIPSTTGPNFGQSDKWCSECNKTVPANHYHQTCPSCNGKKEW